MMEFMHEGGFAMWLTLALFVASIVAAFTRREGGAKLAFAGSLATLASGLLGFSTGIYATVRYLGGVAAADTAEILSIGIRESANNTTLAAVLAFLLAIVGAGLSLRERRAPATATA